MTMFPIMRYIHKHDKNQRWCETQKNNAPNHKCTDVSDDKVPSRAVHQIHATIIHEIHTTIQNAKDENPHIITRYRIERNNIKIESNEIDGVTGNTDCVQTPHKRYTKNCKWYANGPCPEKAMVFSKHA